MTARRWRRCPAIFRRTITASPIAPNWSAKLEYMHYDLGTATCGIGLCSAVTPANVRFEADTGKVGINYHFNWGPAMGRY